MDKAILTRVEEHLKNVIDAGLEWVGIFLQGSQNYGLDYEQSNQKATLTSWRMMNIVM